MTSSFNRRNVALSAAITMRLVALFCVSITHLRLSASEPDHCSVIVRITGPLGQTYRSVAALEAPIRFNSTTTRTFYPNGQPLRVSYGKKFSARPSLSDNTLSVAVEYECHLPDGPPNASIQPPSKHLSFRAVVKFPRAGGRAILNPQDLADLVRLNDGADPLTIEVIAVLQPS